MTSMFLTIRSYRGTDLLPRRGMHFCGIALDYRAVVGTVSRAALSRLWNPTVRLSRKCTIANLQAVVLHVSSPQATIASA